MAHPFLPKKERSMYINENVVENVDPRNAFQRLNRQAIVWLLQANGIEGIHDGMPKDKLEKIAEINSDDILEVRADGKYRYKNVVAYLNHNGETKIERPDCADTLLVPKEPVKRGRKPTQKEEPQVSE